MGRLLDEPALALERLVDPAEHLVEGVGELAQLVGRARRRLMRRDRSVAWMSRATAGDATDRREHPAGDEPPDHEAGEEQERRAR